MIFKALYLSALTLATLSCVNAAAAPKEIELKIRISDAQHAALEKWLSLHATYDETGKQDDYYLRNPSEPWDTSKGFKDTLRTLRVRSAKKGGFVCYKYAHLDPVTKKITHRDEYETKVGDGLTMLEILGQLGYTQRTLVSKTRTTYLVRNTFEIALDTVESVGKFVEIELKKQTNDVKAGIKAIEDLLREIGITEFTEYERSYIHMIWNPDYNFGKHRSLKP